MKSILWITALTAGSLMLLAQKDFSGVITKSGALPAIAVPDFRGDSGAQPFMAAFNQTLWRDLEGSAIFNMLPKTSYPLTVPQQISDLKPPGQTAGGLSMSDWSSPPTKANYLTMGYSAVQNNLFVVRGWLADLGVSSPANAAALTKTYAESLDEAGARKAAHEFAADILARFGASSLFGSHIYFTRKSGTLKDPVAEIWVMDPDGSNQRQVTHFNALSDFPSVAPDGSKIAFTSWVRGNPGIFIFSVDPVRDLRFYNQRGVSVTASPAFTPDGKQVVFMSSAAGCCRIFAANLDGTGVRAVSTSSAIDAEPKVNPKNGTELVFTSGRSGPQQIYRMNLDGTDVQKLSDGTGEASNPSWHPDGQLIAFAWTRGYMAGAFNIFMMNVATGKTDQLTHGEGKNENPSWAPDGKHLVFMSTRTGSSQIFSMLADGTQVQQLTTQGSNLHPVWGK